jgi:pyridoxine/pyridoxamine 5'-phosphate oxidase
MNRFETLDRYFIQSWDLLFRAAQSRNDPMRTPMMATYDGKNCHLRTIVLRKVDKEARQLLFFTDIRSPKALQLKAHPNTAITFWHPARKIQLRIQGSAYLEQSSEEARQHWDHLSVRGRESYATIQPPGELSTKDTTGLPTNWSAELPKKETDFAFSNFTLIKVRIEAVDALHLHSEGHQRASFEWKKEEWEMKWLIA